MSLLNIESIIKELEDLGFERYEANKTYLTDGNSYIRYEGTNPFVYEIFDGSRNVRVYHNVDLLIPFKYMITPGFRGSVWVYMNNVKIEEVDVNMSVASLMVLYK